MAHVGSWVWVYKALSGSMSAKWNQIEVSGICFLAHVMGSGLGFRAIV